MRVTQIVLEKVSKTYVIDRETVVAVRDVSFGVESGEFLSMVGHSGSGKTTLLSMIGGIVRPSSGRIIVGGEEISSLNGKGLPDYRSSRIGFMFQFSSLLPVLTAKENVLLPLTFRSGKVSSSDESKAMDLLRMVGLADRINAYPFQLSGGQQRRVAIARAFVNDPAIVLADEPTGDLDEATEREMMQVFKIMNETKGITFILVTHNSDLAREAHRRFAMNRGSLASLDAQEKVSDLHN